MAQSQHRSEVLLERLQIQGKVSISEAMEILSLSEASVRRLFAGLEKEGRLVRVYGGVQRITSTFENNYFFNDMERKQLPNKKAIAQYACGLLTDNDTVYLDSGTTVYQLALAIKDDLVRKKINQIRVITNSMANLHVLQEVCDVIVIGGTYRPYRKDFAGYISEGFIKQFKFRKSFLGTDGFHLSDGFMATDIETARLNEAVIPRCDESFVLLDSGKIGRSSFISYASADKIAFAITDNQTDNEMKTLCETAGLKMLVASAVE